MATDPVCGMEVAEGGEHTLEHEGRRYHFCSAHCREKFAADPAAYVGGAEKAPESGKGTGAATGAGVWTCPMHPEVRRDAPGSCPKCGMALERMDAAAAPVRTEWVCPMHPEIVRDRPGNCPKCGMALEPRTVAAEEEENDELRSMTRRFWVSTGLSVPARGHRHGAPPARHGRVVSRAGRRRRARLDGTRPGDARRPLGRLALLRPRLAVARQPQPQHVHADRPGRGRRLPLQPRRRTLPGDFPRLVPGRWRARSAVYFEAAAVITTLVLLGQVLELRARSRTGSGHPGAAGPRAEDRAARPGGRRPRRTSPSSTCSRGTGCGCAPARRCRSDGVVVGGDERRGRVDDHRRAHPGGEEAGRQGHRRHRERDRLARHGGRAGGGRHAARRRSSGWWPRPSAAARPSRSSPTWSRAGSCRPSSRSAAATFVVWAWSVPSPAWPTPSSTRWPCSSSPAPAPWGSRRPCRSWSPRARGRRWGCSSGTPRPSRTCARWTPWWWTRPGRSPRASRPCGGGGCRAEWTRRSSCGSPRAWSGGASTRWPPPSWREPRPGAWRSHPSRPSSRFPARACGAGWRASDVVLGTGSFLEEPRHRIAVPRGAGGATAGRRADRHVRGRGRARLPACSAWRTRSRPPPRRRSGGSTTTASGSSCSPATAGPPRRPWPRRLGIDEVWPRSSRARRRGR